MSLMKDLAKLQAEAGDRPARTDAGGWMAQQLAKDKAREDEARAKLKESQDAQASGPVPGDGPVVPGDAGEASGPEEVPSEDGVFDEFEDESEDDGVPEGLDSVDDGFDGPPDEGLLDGPEDVPQPQAAVPQGPVPEPDGGGEIEQTVHDTSEDDIIESSQVLLDEQTLPPQEPARPARSKQAPVQPRQLKPRTKAQADALGTVQIPGFPKALMAMIRADLPAASNNTEALAAWVYVKSPEKIQDVPDNIKKLAGTFRGDQDIQFLKRIDSTLDHISRLLNDMGKDHTNFELALAYLIIERMNLIDQPNVEGFDVTLPNIEEIRRKLHRQGSQVQRWDKERQGRAINQARSGKTPQD